jgi:triacylglycerol lipase
MDVLCPIDIDLGYELEKDSCATRYPVMLVHGILARDVKSELNWGRIPGMLRDHGAVVVMGGHDGAGSCETNARQLRERILALTHQLQSKKLHLIAHSKGGLDVRRMIVQDPSIAEHIATLTTIATPHHGLHYPQIIERPPQKLRDIVVAPVNGFYHLWGDRAPDIVSACINTTVAACEELAQAEALAELVHGDTLAGIPCQSIAGYMRDLRQDPLAIFTHGLSRRFDGDNDGVVSTESAKWLGYRGVVRTEDRRGVSHFDLRDMRRRNFQDFSVPRFYAELVAEQKRAGL